MNKISLNKRSLRSALLLGAASATAMTLSLPVAAQDEATETVIVTGSRIPQTGLYSASPVTVIGSQEVQLTGSVNVESLLDQIPQQFGGETSGSDLNSSGETTVNLRNLGASRTLVLIDGTRFAPSNLGATVDLDSLPTQMIDHVEVVTGGASAVYGSDAVAGVVNIILKKDFEGIELNSTYSEYTHGDGETNDFSGIMGVNSADGKGNVTLYAGYTSRAPVWAKNRAWDAQYMLSNGTNLVPAGSEGTPAGDFYLASGPNAGSQLTPTSTGTFRPDCALSCTEATDPYGAADFFNSNHFEMLQTQQTRYNIGGDGHYEVNKQLEFYTRVMYSDVQIHTQIAPVTTGFYTFTVTGDNTYLSPQEDNYLFGTPTPSPSAVADFYLGKRLSAIGPRIIDYDIQNYQVVIGAKGDLGDGWSYDVSGQIGHSSKLEHYVQWGSLAGLQEAINCGSPSVAETGCQGWDIFTTNPALDGLTPAGVQQVSSVALEEVTTQETDIQGALTGDLASIGGQSPWAKDPIALSVGAEYRQELGQVEPDQTLQDTQLLGVFSGIPPVAGGFSVIEGFGEIKVPIVEGKPFFQDLEFDGGYRYSSYSTAGANTSYKYGLEWAPIDDFKFRALQQKAVRAPNLSELYTPDSIGAFTGSDPCAVGNHPTGNEEALCLATGASATQGDCPAAQCQELVGGSTALKPEIAKTNTYGVVFTPQFLDGFTATVDYYNIKLTGAVAEFLGGGANTLQLCYQPAGGITNVAAQLATPACQAVHRNATGGFLGAGPNAGYVSELNANTALDNPEGIDVEMNYQTDLSRFGARPSAGAISWNFNGTYQISWKQQGSQVAPIYNCAGLYGNTCGVPDPDYRFNTRLSWESANDDFLVSVRWRFIGGVEFDAHKFAGTTDIPDDYIPAVSYFDLSGDWVIREGVMLTAGLNNIFDKQPPMVSAADSVSGDLENSIPETYDLTGRQVFVSLQIKY